MEDINMCGLFGFSYYGKGKPPAKLSQLTKLLAEASSVRGTDATGIAYISKRGKLQIKKRDVDAYNFSVQLPEGTRAVMGHTRRTTQGNEKVNRNNHPFPGSNESGKFALAHNGVLDNDYEVKIAEQLPHTNVETDSYVAVQLLEKYGTLDHESFKKVGETVSGMFAFTILDEQNNIHIIRNDSPLKILHFESLEMYVYASTEDILLEAVTKYQPTREAIWNNFAFFGDVENMAPSEGDIWTINNSDGTIEKSKFEPNDRWDYNPLYAIAGGGEWYSRQPGRALESFHAMSTGSWDDNDVETYIQVIQQEVEAQGFSADDVDTVINSDLYNYDDIEWSIYNGTFGDLLEECQNQENEQNNNKEELIYG